MFSPSKKATKALYFTEDILDELAEKTGKEKELLRDIMKHNTDYLKKSIKENPEIVTVSFPNFGKMIFNYYLGLCALSTTSKGVPKDLLIKRKDFLYSLLLKENGKQLKNFNKPLLSVLLYRITKDPPRNILKSFYKNWKLAELKHNEDHAKYF